MSIINQKHKTELKLKFQKFIPMVRYSNKRIIPKLHRKFALHWFLFATEKSKTQLLF